MRPGEFLSRLFWRVGPIVLIIWAVRSGAIDYQKYIRMIKGETKTPVQIQLDQLAVLLIEQYKDDRLVPEGYQFAFWVTQNEGARAIGPRAHIDPFGNSIRLKRIPDGFVLTSDGPDKKQNTPDDVTKKVEGLEKLSLQ